jgi:tRNA G26 N,N-dimethylase Trm1
MKTKTSTWKSIQKAGNKISLDAFEEQKMLTASQAQENVKKVGGAMKSILKDINQNVIYFSERGYTKLCYSLCQVNKELKSEIVTKLKNLGYKVDSDDLGLVVNISW